MTPPEKMLLTQISSGQKVEVFEYHLAPVWHDAVKEPPKEGGLYLTLGAQLDLEILKFEGGWNYFDQEYYLWFGQSNPPRYWMPIPEPPKESEG